MSGTNSYIVADEYDWTGPYKNRTDAVKECKRWRLEGRNAEVIRRIPKHLADRERAIMPRFYERSADQVFNHSQAIANPIEVRGDVEDGGPAARWYERSLDDWDAPVYLQPELVASGCEPSEQPAPTLPSLQDALALSPQELWMEHRGWSSEAKQSEQ